MKNESQYGLLLLQQYLYENTDDQHPASVADILAFWREHGIQAGRKSVYSAIEVLQSNGMDIVCVKSTQNRYFVGERLFELPELKLLVDAVESSRFITAKKSERLIEKLGKLTSESHARQLDRHIYMEGTAKPENESICPYLEPGLLLCCGLVGKTWKTGTVPGGPNGGCGIIRSGSCL